MTLCVHMGVRNLHPKFLTGVYGHSVYYHMHHLALSDNCNRWVLKLKNNAIEEAESESAFLENLRY